MTPGVPLSETDARCDGTGVACATGVGVCGAARLIRKTVTGVATTSAATTAITTVMNRRRACRCGPCSNTARSVRSTAVLEPAAPARSSRYARRRSSNGSRCIVQRLPQVGQGSGKMLSSRPGTASHEAAALIERVAVRVVQDHDRSLAAAQELERTVPGRLGLRRRRTGEPVVDGTLLHPAQTELSTVTDALAHTDACQPGVPPRWIPKPVPAPPGGDHDVLHHVFRIGGVADDDGRDGKQS